MPRGGRRTGSPGTAYPNRSDLNAPLPQSAATNQPYGRAGQQLASQKIVPMAPSPIAAAPPAAPSQPMVRPPGASGPFDRPTERPREPVTAGLPVGPGPGPEALGLGPPITAGAGNLAVVLGQLASASGDSNLAMLAQRARNLGQ